MNIKSYKVYHWRVFSHWRSGAVSSNNVYIALPGIEYARDYICAHVKRFYPISDVMVEHSVSLINIISQEETLPAAYRLNDEGIWGHTNVINMYPEIFYYWSDKGCSDIRVMPCGPVDEDCLYLNGKWHSYCRFPHEWMQRGDLCEELLPPLPKAKRRK